MFLIVEVNCTAVHARNACAYRWCEGIFVLSSMSCEIFLSPGKCTTVHIEGAHLYTLVAKYDRANVGYRIKCLFENHETR